MKYVVFSFPKSGTHFIKSFYTHLTHEPIAHDHAHHYGNFSVNNLLKKYRNTKIFFPYRDPRDALVSYVFWVDKLERQHNDRAREFGHKEWQTWSHERKLIEVLKGDRQPTMLKNIEVLPMLFENFSANPQVCVIKFEDFIGENAGGDSALQIKTMQDLSLFILGDELNEEELKSALEASWGQDVTFDNPKIGKWREYFTSNVVNSFKNSVWNDALIKLGYESDSNWSN
jgi:hypothetical protein